MFDLQPDDIYWCTADIGWITGHSYIVYGPLANGATTLMFEGIPTYPDASRYWEIVDRHKVTKFYTAPTAIRSLMRLGDAPVNKTSRASLKILGSVGEPIDAHAWSWYHEVVGGGRCPIVDTWWQTETGGHMLTPLPGAMALKPGSCSLPFFGVKPEIFDAQGNKLDGVAEGMLCIGDSWPGQARSVWGDHDRFVKTYFSQIPSQRTQDHLPLAGGRIAPSAIREGGNKWMATPSNLPRSKFGPPPAGDGSQPHDPAPYGGGHYFTSDGCRRDADGYYWITGRVDDVIKVSGHLLGTAEIEATLMAHEGVAEAAVVGYPHDVKGYGVYAYVILNEGVTASDDMTAHLKLWVRQQMGAFAAPDFIHITPGLPKTRSGKIMRRILRKIAENDVSNLGDTSTLLDPAVVDGLIATRMRG